MLQKEAFVKAFMEKFAERFGTEYILEEKHVPVNNGAEYVGMLVHKKGRRSSPVLKIHELYEEYQSGTTVDELITEVMESLLEPWNEMEEKADEQRCYEEAKEKIMVQLVNYNKNKEMLTRIPHKRYLDMAIIFRVVVHVDDRNGVASYMVNQSVFETWNVDVDELYKQAIRNMVQTYPISCVSLQEFLLGVTYPNIPQLYIFTNTMKTYGAAAILYPDMLKKMAEQLGGDLLILPSSIHEVLLLRYDPEQNINWFQEMVCSINRSDVAERDVLSNHVYIYRREKDMVEIAEAEEHALTA